jgi:hypothetical protein
MSNEIISQEVQTREEEISGLFCSCGHLVEEHFVGEISKSSTCYALVFNGISFSRCWCERMKELSFSITVTVEDFEDATNDEISGDSEDRNSEEESSS